jgi:Ca-activated chloride channel family protein
MTTNEHEKFSPDDPRLTAYALGELEGAEHAAVEAALREDAALRATVEEIRATVVRLEGALAGEALPAVPEWKSTPKAETDAIRRAAIIDGGGGYKLDGGPQRAPLIRFPQFYYVVSGLAAACFVVFVLVNDPGEAPAAAKMTERRVRTVINLPPLEAASGETKSNATVAVALPPEAPESPTIVGAASRRMEFQLDRLPVSEGIAAGVLNENLQRVNPAEDLDPQRLAATAKARASKAVAATSPQSRPQIVVASDQGKGARDMVPADSGASLHSLGGAGSERFVKSLGIVATSSERSSPATESYAYRQDAGFLSAAENPLSTFAADVDTASYSNVRRMLRAGQRPPADAVRVEELVNYFPYRYAAPKTEVFAAALEVADAPWAAGHRLVRIGLKAREVAAGGRGAANLVFLVDVSGSMTAPERLPLVKESLRLLVNRLRPDDRVAIVTYAGASGLALASTPVRQGREIAAAIEAMTPGGSTNGGMGIQLAYDIAKANFVTGGVNRVLLCTDGDFNVGVTGEGALVRLVQEKAKSGVFLTVLGYGMGNLKDSMLEAIADKGNGSYGYIDSRREAEKLLGAQVNGTLTTVAKDVKLQVEFNPARVASYRLIGYENWMLAKEDFNNDEVDAGEVGAGHTVTALYEVVPVERAGGEGREAMGGSGAAGAVDALKYSRPPERAPLAEGSGELLTLKVRFKAPDGDESRKLEFALTDAGTRFSDASADFKFAGAVAAFGMMLRDSPHKGTATWSEVQAWAAAGAAADPGGWRGEFVELVRAASVL